MSGAASPFQIDRMPRVVSQLRSITRRAMREGRLEQVAKSIESAMDRLAADPEEFGEPEFDAKFPGATVFHGFSGRILFHFVVYRKQRLVMLLGIKDMDGRE